MGQAKNCKADELRAEYDFSGGIRGKHYVAYKAGTNVVVLDPQTSPKRSRMLPRSTGRCDS